MSFVSVGGLSDIAMALRHIGDGLNNIAKALAPPPPQVPPVVYQTTDTPWVVHQPYTSPPISDY